MKSIAGFLSEVKIELTKVTWPTRNEVIRLTAIVLLFATALGLYVGGLDFLFTKILALVVTK